MIAHIKNLIEKRQENILSVWSRKYGREIAKEFKV